MDLNYLYSILQKLPDDNDRKILKKYIDKTYPLYVKNVDTKSKKSLKNINIDEILLNDDIESFKKYIKDNSLYLKYITVSNLINFSDTKLRIQDYILLKGKNSIISYMIDNNLFKYSALKSGVPPITLYINNSNYDFNIFKKIIDNMISIRKNSLYIKDNILIEYIINSPKFKIDEIFNILNYLIENNIFKKEVIIKKLYHNFSTKNLNNDNNLLIFNFLKNSDYNYDENIYDLIKYSLQNIEIVFKLIEKKLINEEKYFNKVLKHNNYIAYKYYRPIEDLDEFLKFLKKVYVKIDKYFSKDTSLSLVSSKISEVFISALENSLDTIDKKDIVYLLENIEKFVHPKSMDYIYIKFQNILNSNNKNSNKQYEIFIFLLKYIYNEKNSKIPIRTLLVNSILISDIYFNINDEDKRYLLNIINEVEYFRKIIQFIIKKDFDIDNLNKNLNILIESIPNKNIDKFDQHKLMSFINKNIDKIDKSILEKYEIENIEIMSKNEYTSLVNNMIKKGIYPIINYDKYNIDSSLDKETIFMFLYFKNIIKSNNIKDDKEKYKYINKIKKIMYNKVIEKNIDINLYENAFKLNGDKFLKFIDNLNKHEYKKVYNFLVLNSFDSKLDLLKDKSINIKDIIII